MANKKKRQKANNAGSSAPMSKAEREAMELRRYKRTKLTLIIFAAVAAVAIVAAAVFGIVSAVLSSERADYMNGDLGKYIYISEKDYRSFPVSVKLDPIDEMAVDGALAEALYAFREVEEEYNGANYVTFPIKDGVRRTVQAGDTVYIYYVGYEVGDDGSKEYFDGGCNFSSSDPYELGIGSGSFITGFETGLIGASPDQYSTLETVKSRGIEYGDYVVFTYTVISSGADNSENQRNVTVTIKLEEGISDERFGVGFEEFMLGKTKGEIDGHLVTTRGTDKLTYSDMKISTIVNGGDNPLTVTARFPVGYSSSADLAGKTVKFDVYIKKARFYTTPEINEEFVTERLKMTLDELSEYGEDGDSILECYRGYLEEGLKASAMDSLSGTIRTAMWEHYDSKVVIKRLPEGEVREYYDDFIEDITDEYERNSSYYSSFDEFVVTYLGIDTADGWEAKVRTQAELAVSEKLIFYYIARREGFIPTGEVYEENYDRVVEELLATVLDAYKCTEDKYETREEYERAVEEYRALMLEGYGEDYFRDNVIYEYAISKLEAFADITYE